MFSQQSPNYNGFITASTGSGKSVTVNAIMSNYYAAGAMGRIIDIGGSYKKQAFMFEGRFLDFDDNSKVRINPFATIAIDDGDEETKKDIDEDLATICSIVQQMVVSATNQLPGDDPETGLTLINDAVRWAYDQQLNVAGHLAGIDDVFEYLVAF